MLLIEKETLLTSSRKVESLEKESREKSSLIDDLTQKLTHLKMQYNNVISEQTALKENLKNEIQFLKVNKKINFQINILILYI